MQSKFAYLLASMLALSANASAETLPIEANTPIAPVTNLASQVVDTSSADNLSFLRFATVVNPGEITEPGDMIKISREFSNWTLRCDVRLSTNRRACFVEQGESTNGTSLVWRIAVNEQNRAIALISVPDDVDMDRGIRMKFAGLEKVLDRDMFRCSPQACIGGFYFGGFVQRAITSSDNVGFSFSRKQADTVDIEMSMTGFTTALDAGARDPFGRDVPSKASAQSAKSQSVKPVTSSSAKSRPAAIQTKAPKQTAASNGKVAQNRDFKKKGGLY